MIKLKTLYENLIKEVGELENIDSYSFSQFSPDVYEFKTDDGLKIEVWFDEIECPKHVWVWNVSYKIEGVESQLKKETYKYLIKVIKTVFDIVIDWIKNNPEVKHLSLFAGHKDESRFLSQTDDQKHNLYKIIYLKNRHKLPGEWIHREIEVFEGFKGLVISKK